MKEITELRQGNLHPADMTDESMETLGYRPKTLAEFYIRPLPVRRRLTRWGRVYSVGMANFTHFDTSRRLAIGKRRSRPAMESVKPCMISTWRGSGAQPRSLKSYSG